MLSELERTGELTCVKVSYFPGVTEEDHKTLSAGWLISCLRFKLGNC